MATLGNFPSPYRTFFLKNSGNIDKALGELKK